MSKTFKPKSRITDVAKNILRKRYYHEGETKWRHVASRVVNHVCHDWSDDDKSTMYDIIYNRYFLPNSPTLVNAGKNKNAGLSACFALPMDDTIEDIIKTKGDFLHIARSGGGCGTTLSNLRPKGDPVNGSTHGYAGGGIAFGNTISVDAKAMTQSGFREMALMFTFDVRHPDILDFITAKTEEGKISNANISVMVDDDFMRKVENEETYWTEFNSIKYRELNAKDVFDMIVDGAWRNGEPGLGFSDTINNNSPYRYNKVKLETMNPCGI